MASFKFIHAADLHLDSPLTGLASKSEHYARRIDDASRVAFSRLIQLAIDEECAFVLVAGDLFDGQWRDYRTGLFFASQMGLLRDAGISAYLILGNHDAENKFASRLQLTDNVTLLSSKAPQTVRIDSLRVAIHGQSFPTRDVTTNLAASYPAPEPGWLNIGMLHTALDGREGHALYAPCTVDQLKNHGYQYWALGHVHDFGHQYGATKAIAPYIVYSGVLQGRHIRETGPKGAVLVLVNDGEIESVDHIPLDSVRWAAVTVDVEDAQDLDSIASIVRRHIETAYSDAGGRSLAARITLTGNTPLQALLATSRSEMRELIETALAGVSSEIWLEKLDVRTTDVSLNTDKLSLDPTIVGSIRAYITKFSTEHDYNSRISKLLEEIRMKMPPGTFEEAVRERLVADAAIAARDHALAVIEKGLE